MRGFLTKSLLASILLTGWTFPVFAQNSTDTPARGASFLPAGVGDLPAGAGFSGLATGQPESVLPPASTTTSVTPPPAAPGKAAPPLASVVPDISVTPVVAAPLPNVSPESIGAQNADGLGADMWKGTQHQVAEALVALIAPTNSPALNKLVRHLLMTAAVPPEGEAGTGQSLTSARADKLVLFGDAAHAWDLAKHAEPKLIDDTTFRLIAESAQAGNGDDLCPDAITLARAHITADWQKFMIVCQLRAKDNQAAQVALDVFRAQNNRDNVFLEIADKNILGNGKTLPFHLTPMTSSTLALLQMANLPLPVSLYAHADSSFTPALLRIPAQQDVAQLSLAERAAEHGLIGASDLAAVYKATNFSADALASPLTASESGLRLRALLFRAAENDKDPGRRISYAVKFVQSASPSFLNGAGSVAAVMLGDIKADPTLAGSAAIVARIYMLADKGDAALEWYRLAQSSSLSADDLQALWPQFALAGFEADSSFAASLSKWMTAALKNNDAQTAHDIVTPTLLLLDAGGMKIPDAVWAKVLTAAPNEKKAAFSPLFFDRMQVAANANRRAETVLLAAASAGGGEISVPVALGIIRALRQAGFKSEAAIFARQAIAVLAKAN